MNPLSRMHIQIACLHLHSEPNAEPGEARSHSLVLLRALFERERTAKCFLTVYPGDLSDLSLLISAFS